MTLLEIKNLHVKVDNEEILKGLNLKIDKGEIAVIMGPNGSGKTTLSNVIMGHPKYEVTKGQVLLDGEDITELRVDKRAKKGLFLAFQYPSELAGVSVSNFLRLAYRAVKDPKVSLVDFRHLLNQKMKLLNIDHSFAKRYLNEGFSGGEKKRTEVLQMAVLEPRMVVLDEIDSGLDIDALKVVAHGINRLIDKDRSFLIITHYQRILDYVKPDKVHILWNGKIVKSGGPELAKELEAKGYDWVKGEEILTIS